MLFEVLSIAARKKMSRIMKMKSASIQRKREISMKRKASPEKIKKRAEKKAISIVVNKLLKGRDRSELGQSGKEALEKRLKKKKAVIKKIAKKMLPFVKKAEKVRMAKLAMGMGTTQKGEE
jgi:hypothetical protein